MRFDFDPRKSESNKAKHGIDFVQAQTLWRSKHVLLAAKDATEKRYMVIGTIGLEHWSAIITYRGATIRIISVRRSTPPRSQRMKKPEPDPTTARNLEDKFDRGEEVLDYFALSKAQMIRPDTREPVAKANTPTPTRRNSRSPTAIVREDSPRYGKKK